MHRQGPKATGSKASLHLPEEIRAQAEAEPAESVEGPQHLEHRRVEVGGLLAPGVSTCTDGSKLPAPDKLHEAVEDFPPSNLSSGSDSLSDGMLAKHVPFGPFQRRQQAVPVHLEVDADDQISSSDAMASSVAVNDPPASGSSNGTGLAELSVPRRESLRAKLLQLWQQEEALPALEYPEVDADGESSSDAMALPGAVELQEPPTSVPSNGLGLAELSASKSDAVRTKLAQFWQEEERAVEEYPQFNDPRSWASRSGAGLAEFVLNPIVEGDGDEEMQVPLVSLIEQVGYIPTIEEQSEDGRVSDTSSAHKTARCRSWVGIWSQPGQIYGFLEATLGFGEPGRKLDAVHPLAAACVSSPGDAARFSSFRLAYMGEALVPSITFAFPFFLLSGLQAPESKGDYLRYVLLLPTMLGASLPVRPYSVAVEPQTVVAVLHGSGSLSPENDLAEEYGREL